MTTDEKPHISATQLNMAGKCWEQYRRRYICGEKIPPAIALLVGRGYHKGAEGNFKQKLESHRDLPSSDIVEMAVTEFETGVAGGYQLDPRDEKRGASIVLGEAKTQVVNLAAVHASSQAPDYQPTAVEVSTRIIFPSASHDLLCITDLRDDQGRIIDFKSAGKKPAQAEADQSPQLTIEAAAMAVDTGELPTEVRLDVVTKTSKPKRHILASTRTRRDFGVLLARTNAMLQALESFKTHGLEVWPAAPVGAWWCSARMCGYALTCPHYNAEREAAAEEN